MIEINNVSHTYRSGALTTEALRNINFKIQQGEIVAVTGSSGSGKSTLLNIIGCLLAPSNGTVLIMGRNVQLLDDKEQAALRLKYLGFIFQSFNLIPVLCAMENVEYPLILLGLQRHERKRMAESMLEKVGLLSHAKKRPDQLSGGQRQRVAIARALVTSPNFVLADEPTANLDSRTATDILKLMEDLNKEINTAFIFSTHDPKVSAFAQKKFHLEDGVLM